MQVPSVSIFVSSEHRLLQNNFFRTLQELDVESLGPAEATDIRLVQQEKRRLQEVYQNEIDRFIEHLK